MTALLRVSEVYQSIQGEGPNVGSPTTFVRFAGCNLRCPLWPCDTPHAIEPRIFEKEQLLVSPQDLVHQLNSYPSNICITGGEPFIQNSAALETFVTYLKAESRLVECFSNGTIKYPTWATEKMTMVMDWKLPGSGEDDTNVVRRNNACQLAPGSYIKFVIADRHDFDVAVSIWQEFRFRVNYGVEWSYGVAWNKLDNAKLIEWVLGADLPWKLNMQVHNFIWDRKQRGI